ncbi:MAG: DUF507 family protein [Candidatus Binataceae bacterium]
MITEAQIDSLANFLVHGLLERGSIKPRADEKDLVACVVEMMSDNFETERRIDDEAERMATEQARANPGIDPTRMRMLIRQRLAQKQNFTL